MQMDWWFIIGILSFQTIGDRVHSAIYMRRVGDMIIRISYT